ncbi:MAG TPA: PQQ-dependent sugar dehydrogenase [Solirubrobacteraceae bacterium]
MKARFTAVGCGALLLSLLSACGTGQAARSTRTEAPVPNTAGEAGAGHAKLKLVQVGSFEQPIYVTGAPDDESRLFVVEKQGRIALVLNGKKQSRPFLDITRIVNSEGSEQGLIGLAFPADYSSSGVFYVDYTGPNNDLHIVQYHRSASDPDTADTTSERAVLTIPHPNFSNHNGGQLAFGPDGDLYVGVGDGGSEDDPHNNGQNTDTLLAKILRIAPKPNGGYEIPPSNPFVGQAGKRAEIWAYGLRNPWRFSFDRQTGAMVIGDVGQDLEEEIDYAAAGKGRGANYGWSVFEGDRRNKPGSAPHAVRPALVALHSAGYCAIIGGYVVRDRSLPALYGQYLFGDDCRPQIEAVTLGHGPARHLHSIGLQVSATTSFGQDAAGHIYVASLNGPVYRLVER